MTASEWKITAGPEVVPPDADVVLFRWTVEREGESREVFVAISGTLMATQRTTLASPIDVIVATKGEAALLDSLSRDRVPRRITVSTAGVIEDLPE